MASLIVQTEMLPVPPAIFSKQQRSALLFCLLLLSFGLYANSIVNGFVYDDHSQIERNPYVHSFAYVGQIFGSSLLAQQGKQAAPNFYRPIMNFSFLICYKLFGASPYGFHLINIFLNCIVVWLVFAVSSDLFSNEWMALIAAAAFALHPIHTEAIAWIDGIADLYVAIFYLLAFWLFLRQTTVITASQRTRIRAGVILSFALALFSKEIAMTFPVLVTVYEHWLRVDRRATNWRQKTSRYWWIWATLCVYLVIRALSVGRLAPARLHTDISFREVVFTALSLIGQYATKLFWPRPLAAFYPFQKSVSCADPHVLFGLASVLAAAFATTLLWRRARLYAFAIFWVGLILAPALNARWMTATVFAERYLYLPSVGFCWLFAGLVFWLWSKPREWARNLHWVLIAAGAILMAFSSSEIIARNRDWITDRTLIISALAAHPNSPHMLSDLGQMEWYEEDHAGAERDWQLALKYAPDTVEVLANLGSAMIDEGKYDQARAYLQKAISLKPKFATPHVYLGKLYLAQGKAVDAEDEFRRAIEIHPTDVTARKALGKFLIDQNRFPEAETDFQVAVNAVPDDEETWLALGQIYAREGARDKAEHAWREVLALDPFSSHAHVGLGRIYLSQGKTAQAREEFHACLRINPHHSEALASLATLGEGSGSPTGVHPAANEGKITRQ